MTIKRPRRTSEKHLAFIRSLPSLVYNDGTCEAAHIRFAEIMIGKRITGMGEKPDDMWTVPLSSPAHREQHRESERAFWARHDINPLIIAALLWTQSGDHEAACNIIQNAKGIAPWSTAV